MNNELIVDTLTDEDCGYIHDVVIEATWETTKTNLTNEQCKKLFLRLDNYIIGQAVMWGVGDTVVRDNIYDALKNEPELLSGL